MNTNQLLYFVATVRLGSYAAAAKSVFISPPGVSRAVGELEKELGIKLVERSGKVVQPTRFGGILYGKAIEILQEAEDLKSLAKDLSRKETGDESLSLAISITPYRGTVIRQGAIDYVIEACPEIELSLLRSSSSSCLAALDEGVVQAAILLGRAEKEWATSYRLFSFCPEIAISKTHPLAIKEELELKELMDYPIAQPIDLRYCYPTIASTLEKTGKPVTFDEVFPSKQNLLRFLDQKHGIIFVARDAFLESSFSNAVFFRPKDLNLSIPVCFAHRSDNQSRTISIVKNRFISASRLA